MSKADKPVAKSLHTITVIVQVAKLHMAGIESPTNRDANKAVNQAMATLGLMGRDDPYNLRDKALAQLSR